MAMRSRSCGGGMGWLGGRRWNVLMWGVRVVWVGMGIWGNVLGLMGGRDWSGF